MPMEVFECAGLTIASEISISAPVSALIDPATADVTVVWGFDIEPTLERPSADVLAELIEVDRLSYSICRVDDGYVLRLPFVADFAVDAALRHVTCHPVATGRTSVIPLIIPGMVVAFILSMSGKCVLHGSAVELDGRALAFVGPSGQGKSTMAAILCAAGAGLVTDDVLPLGFDETGREDTGVYCLRAASEIRLREKAASLARRFGEDAVRVTADDRYAVAPRTSTLQRIPLAAIVFPRPDRQHLEVVAKRVGPGEASLALGRCERIEGWWWRDHLRTQFIALSGVVEAVPVFEVSVPWGPPFASDLAPRLLAACGLEGMKPRPWG